MDNFQRCGIAVVETLILRLINDPQALNLDSVLHYRPKLLIFILCTHSLSLVSMKLVRRRIVKRLHGQLQIYSKLFSFQSEMARIL